MPVLVTNLLFYQTISLNFHREEEVYFPTKPAKTYTQVQLDNENHVES